MAARTGVPAEITSLLIEVLNGESVIVDVAEVVGTEGTVVLQVPAGSGYRIRGRALAGSELLFLGETDIGTLAAGSSRSVSLTLLEQVVLDLTALGDTVIGADSTGVGFDLTGLQNIEINWYVNGVAGGSAEFGLIDTAGRYTPPVILPSDPLIEITAEPVIAPSFAQSFTFTLLPLAPNLAPLANAGADQNVPESTLVTLDGSGSSDGDGTIASFSWSLLSGPAITLIDAATATPRFTAPVVTASQQLLFELTVTDDDGASSSDQVSVTVNPVNLPPLANAGLDQAVNEQSPVTLTGAASSDADGNIVTYQWTQLSGTGVTLSSAPTQNPTFIAPTLTTAEILVFELTVTDNENASATDTVAITVNPVNQPPLANAGTDQTVNEQTAVTLTAAASNDADGSIVAYQWNQLSGTGVTLSSTSAQSPTFTAPTLTAAATLVFELTVTDNENASGTDTVAITVNPVNQPPLANAGTDQTVNEQSLVSLSGAASADADGNIVAFQWSQRSGTGVTLSSVSAQSPTFTTPTLTTVETLVFELTVTDNENASATDTVVITVNPVNQPPVANAGADQSVNAQALVNLSAAASSDADGSIVGYNWVQVSNDLAPVLNNPLTPTPSFTAPAVQFGGSVTYRVTVTDNEGATAFDEVTINVNGTDQPLVANAGPDQVVNEATLVTLDATASNDPDDAITGYLWEELSNGGIVINNSTSQVATFTAPDVNDATAFQFRLTVTNDNNEQAIDTVTVTVNNVVTVANDLFFAATTDGFNYNLWASDGTDTGTRQVAAVSLQNQDLHKFKTIGDFFYFVGNDGINGNELWRSDGTTTEMIISAPDSAFPGLGASASVNPAALSVVGNRLLYEANTSYNGTFLFPEYLSLNTADDSLQTVFAGNIASFEPVEVGVAAGFSYFYVNNFSPSVTTDLYRSDGIDSATLVSTFPGFFRLHDFTEVNGEMFFVVGDNQLWKTDGTGPGTSQIKVFSGAVGHSNGLTGENNAVAFNGELYFVADDGQGRELWKSDGTGPGTVLVADLDLAITSTNPTEFRVVNGVLTFLSSEGGAATDGLWVTDGSALGTRRLAALSVNGDVGFYAGADSGVARVVETLGLLFFTADDGVSGSELWVSNGSITGTRPVREINPLDSAFPSLFIAGDGFLLFSAQDADFRAKLWRSDGSETGTVIVRDILPSGFDNQAFFQLGD